jgi:hypothetical protein
MGPARRKPLQNASGIPYDQSGVSQQSMGGVLPVGAQADAAVPTGPAPAPMGAAPMGGMPAQPGLPPVEQLSPPPVSSTQIDPRLLTMMAIKRRMAGV